MKAAEIIIRILAGVVLAVSIGAAALIAMINSQRDILPKIGDYYIELMKDGGMMPTAGEGALLLMKEDNPYSPGDIIAYLNDRNTASVSRIVSIDSKTQDVSVEVPYEELMNTLGNPGISQESVMEWDPEVLLKEDNSDEEVRIPADRIMAKSVFISGFLGFVFSMYQNKLWAAIIIIGSAVICIWPFRYMKREPEYTEQDIDGPWMG